MQLQFIKTISYDELKQLNRVKRLVVVNVLGDFSKKIIDSNDILDDYNCNYFNNAEVLKYFNYYLLDSRKLFKVIGD